MRNFNTNQVRHFYNAGAYKATADAVTANLDVNVGSFGDKENGGFYFTMMNPDGNLTRSDIIKFKELDSMTVSKAESMATPLMAHTIKLDTTKVSLTELAKMKTVDCVITFNEVVDYDPNSTFTIVAQVDCNTANTASETAFHKALAIAIAKAVPARFGEFPPLKVFSNGTEVTKKSEDGDVTGSADGVVLVEGVQKYVRGKLSGDPGHFTVAFPVRGDYLADTLAWGTDTVAASTITGNKTIPAGFVLADLEYFAMGERGDYFRGYLYPFDYTPTYVINPFGDFADTSVLNINFHYAGSAENVQKSPKLIQICGKTTVINSIVSAIKTAKGDTTE